MFLDVEGVVRGERMFLDGEGEGMGCVNMKEGYGLEVGVKWGVDVGIMRGGKREGVGKGYEGVGIKDV